MEKVEVEMPSFTVEIYSIQLPSLCHLISPGFCGGQRQRDAQLARGWRAALTPTTAAEAGQFAGLGGVGAISICQKVRVTRAGILPCTLVQKVAELKAVPFILREALGLHTHLPTQGQPVWLSQRWVGGQASKQLIYSLEPLSC